MSEQKAIVGIADMKLLKGAGEIITYALGSCIGISFYDELIKCGALLHIMLPLSMESNNKSVYKYADSGIKKTLDEMIKNGAAKARIKAKIAGGAQMFAISANMGNIGKRNIQSVKLNLKNQGIMLLKEDVGGEIARTMVLNVANGDVFVRSFGKPEVKL